MKTSMYHNYAPLTWDLAMIRSDPFDVIELWRDRIELIFGASAAISSLDSGLHHALAGLEPLGSASKTLLLQTSRGDCVVVGNHFYPRFVGTQLPMVGRQTGSDTWVINNAPKTIDEAGMAGSWGGRELSLYRLLPESEFMTPTWSVSVINDCGRWVFQRIGEMPSVEDDMAYKGRGGQRFSTERLLLYLDRLGLHVYDASYYTGRGYMVESARESGETRMTFAEAKAYFKVAE